MKNILLVAYSLLMSISLKGQSVTIEPEVQKRLVSSFTKVHISNGIELQLTPGEQDDVLIFADQIEIQNKIKTVVENSTLKIYFIDDSWQKGGSKQHKAMAFVTSNNLKSMYVDSGANVKINGQYKCQKLILATSAGGAVKGTVDSDTLEINCKSGSVVDLTGKVKILHMIVSDGSVFSGFDLIADNCQLDVNSSSIAQITVKENLTGKVESAGKVTCQGKTIVRNVKINNPGTLRYRN